MGCEKKIKVGGAKGECVFGETHSLVQEFFRSTRIGKPHHSAAELEAQHAEFLTQ